MDTIMGSPIRQISRPIGVTAILFCCMKMHFFPVTA